MKNKNYKKQILVLLAGIIIACIGFVLLKLNLFPYTKVVSIFFIVIGCGLFGNNIGEILQNLAIKKNPEEYKQLKIEQNDERNISIANIAKSKAFDLMSGVFGAAMLILALLDSSILSILVLVGAYLLVHFTMIYYLIKLRKEM